MRYEGGGRRDSGLPCTPRSLPELLLDTVTHPSLVTIDEGSNNLLQFAKTFQ